MGGLTFVADWAQPCVARVCSEEIKGGGVRNSAGVGRVQCHPCSRGVFLGGDHRLTRWSQGWLVIWGAWMGSCLVQTSPSFAETIWKYDGQRKTTTTLTLPGASFAGECRQEGCLPAWIFFREAGTAAPLWLLGKVWEIKIKQRKSWSTSK